MSGLYLPGMEMPKSCHECVAGYGGCCFVAPAESDGICPDHGRADFCPLIPVPDHGRLIDADALMKKGIPLSFSVQRWVQEVDIACAPTIIPASGGTDNE